MSLSSSLLCDVSCEVKYIHLEFITYFTLLLSILRQNPANNNDCRFPMSQAEMGTVCNLSNVQALSN
uniref:Uncharacterized protein n=1 Tax=Megaselia scalaris TaxID=36166 RepID=T1H4H5_MEGSC